jgi:glucokinase
MTQIGVDMGGTKCAGILFTDDNAILAETSAPTPAGGEAVLDTIADVIGELLRQSPQRPSCIGVGVPGLVTVTGSLRYAPHLFGVVEVALQELLEERVGQPVKVMNDNTAAAWAEHRVGAGVGFDDMVYVGLGTGIGGAVIANGQLIEGKQGFAGELGHMTVDRNGDVCVCGRRGCWELYASGSGLARLAGRAGETVTEAGRNGDARALAVLRRFASDVAIGLADLVNIFDPGCIVLGGGVLDPPDPLLGLINDALTGYLGDSSSHRPLPEVRAAALGRRAGAYGAALLASGC